MRIGEVAEQAGVNVETLRYYERRGLLPQPARSPGGHREYDDGAVRFVLAVKEAQTLGFTLSEIEEYMSLTRRAPARASAEARRRLEDKLEQVEERLDALRRMRASLQRVLDERWESVASSTSNAAYLARGGLNPMLQPDEPLHVTNGESVAGSLRATALGGVVLSWDDVLHVGPLAFDPPESRRLRATFLADHGWGDAAAIDAELRRRDDLLAGAGTIVLWFEHDLFDQLQLLQILSQVGDHAAVELVQADDFLGDLDPERLEALWPERRRLSRRTIALACDVWRAVTTGELDRDVPELPYVASALRRLAEEREPMPRTKRQLLRALEDGPRTAQQLFFANQAQEEAPFLGDAWCYLFLYELAQDGRLRPVGGGPMPLPPPRGDYEAFASTLLEPVGP